MEAELIKAGLSQNEARIYLSLIKKGPSPASALTKETTVSRPHIYDSINKLIEKGLVSYVIKDSRRYFKAADPKELINFLEDEKEKINAQQEEIKKVLPNLSGLRGQKPSGTSVEVYEGKDGLKTVLMDVCNYSKDFIAFGATYNFEEVLPLFSKLFIQRRERKNQRAKILVVQGEKPVKTKLNTYRWLPKEYSLPNSSIIFST